MGIDPHRKNQADQKKGVFKMSSKSPFARTLIAIAAALVTSTLAVGAAVGPAQAVASQTQISSSIGANLNA
jgi:hypothetical protein